MHVLQGLTQRRQAQACGFCSRQGVGQRVEAAVQHLVGEVADPKLGQTLDGGVHRRQTVFERRGLIGLQHPVFRMHHFKPERTRAHFAVTAQPRAGGQAVLLGP